MLTVDMQERIKESLTKNNQEQLTMTRLSSITLPLAYLAPIAGYFADDYAAPHLFAAGLLAVAVTFLAYITND